MSDRKAARRQILRKGSTRAGGMELDLNPGRRGFKRLSLVFGLAFAN